MRQTEVKICYDWKEQGYHRNYSSPQPQSLNLTLKFAMITYQNEYGWWGLNAGPHHQRCELKPPAHLSQLQYKDCTFEAIQIQEEAII